MKNERGELFCWAAERLCGCEVLARNKTKKQAQAAARKHKGAVVVNMKEGLIE